MTAQVRERLIYEGNEQSLCTEPLSLFFKLGGFQPKFQSTCTALWRGYVGTWEIIDNRLYLIKINGTMLSGEKAQLSTIFPEHPKRVFAHWYSGILRITQGELLKYVHGGYASTYERDLLITVEKGVITNKKIQHNHIDEKDMELDDIPF